MFMQKESVTTPSICVSISVSLIQTSEQPFGGGITQPQVWSIAFHMSPTHHKPFQFLTFSSRLLPRLTPRSFFQEDDLMVLMLLAAKTCLCNMLMSRQADRQTDRRGAEGGAWISGSQKNLFPVCKWSIDICILCCQAHKIRGNGLF